MSNYNKVILDNDSEVLIDLSEDTVTQPSHIVVGHSGHLADGRKVDGTGGGGDVTHEELYDIFPIDKANGLIASFDDGVGNVPVKSLITNIEPIQDLNGYDNPWPNGNENKLPPYDKATQSLGTTVCNFDGNGICTLTAANDSSARTFTFNITPFTTPTGTCYMHLLNDAGNNGVTMSFRDENDALIGQNSFSFASQRNKIIELAEDQKGQTVSKIRIYKNAQSTNFNLTFSPMLLENNTATTTYIPYSNICPISGHSNVKFSRVGKNLLRLVESEMTTQGITRCFPFSIKAGTYTISCQNQFGATYNGVGFQWTDNNKKVIKRAWDTDLDFGDLIMSGNLTFTEDEAKQITTIVIIPWSSGLTYELISAAQLQLEIGTEATNYEPYDGANATAELGDTYYGGIIDAITGVLTENKVTKKITYMNRTNDHNFYIGTGSWDRRPLALSYTTNKLICDRMPTISQPSSVSEAINGIYTDSSRAIVLRTKEAYSSAAAMMSAIGGEVNICFETEPQTYEVTPIEITTLLGKNYIWSNTGDTSVEYRADIQLYYEKLTQPTEDDMIANESIPSGKYFMVGNTLYYSTASIATGDTIIPGTNCTQYSLSGALNQLNS